ncbi:dihydropteroate synthase [Vagococcus carniphilus]|uniref:Dihydropteroate synthase n=1 Tax=Vagococcus carniphilus TaxID=218144 RepID=A0AAW8U5L1_9ENTE|nr:dihydropteroate synthase [Vagococcus carniphilus]MDT2829363.1 dihydropteroate synthase [Vagococcus carniphilus]MDT2833430.1 dihydropteroate synthase [Vagococcus carniphilus]MDT2838822.1 dihydropteroate synthase [Vagococcus carniphilus]MDT2852880.1 dihydropteroate synthase [Vagococcus carniphilus]
MTKVKIMGIVNVTPDSFSDGGQFFDAKKAIEHGVDLAEDGADILDVGGQSTRPGYTEVSTEEEVKRIEPVIKGLREQTDLPISIDTYFPEVAERALSLGANIINDVRGFDIEGMLDVALKYPKSKLIIMHSRPRKEELSVEDDIFQFFKEKYEECQKVGIADDRIIFDPGIGFGKSLEENIKILQQPELFRFKEYPLLYGVSRKRTIAHLIEEKRPLERDYASVAASLFSATKGVEIVRVHQVKGMKDSLKVWNQLN